ncbi:MAG: helix-turn-helix transcriptional regulator [Acidobacteriota bacterium]|nr:helix-turn-helix transcriptional regulator [Acidobacteriota bacterium]
MDHRAEKVITLISNNFHRKLTLGALARTVNLSPSRLRHLFKAETGTTPTQYLHQLRMSRAKLLLETTYLQVKEIRNLVGVGGESRFVQDFKRVYAKTPASYRTSRNGGGSQVIGPEK